MKNKVIREKKTRNFSNLLPDYDQINKVIESKSVLQKNKWCFSIEKSIELYHITKTSSKKGSNYFR